MVSGSVLIEYVYPKWNGQCVCMCACVRACAYIYIYIYIVLGRLCFQIPDLDQEHFKQQIFRII
jgi:hypothetical protein